LRNQNFESELWRSQSITNYYQLFTANRHACYEERVDRAALQGGPKCVQAEHWLVMVVQGGMHVHKGSPAHARVYVEADRHRCGGYYLADGEGIAERWTATRDGITWFVDRLDGQSYERWVAGVDPVTGLPKGRLRNDERANRFQDITINGPKSWSLVAALVPEVAAAYDAVQERAATQVVAWLSGHLTYRVGRRGEQVQAPVDQIEAVMVRHHTSRAGDPHRHIHLQINARVWGNAAWRGLHTVGFRDSLAAMNGIGHAAMMTDPQFRAVLAKWGFSLDSRTGEVKQLAPYVTAFSTRAAQIARNTDRYEHEWRDAHPDREPSPRLRREWDAMAWADGRPQKHLPDDPAEQTARWVRHLYQLGYQPPRYQATVQATPVGHLDRDAAAQLVLSRLAAKGSRWNAADVRGQVERLIAEVGVVADAAVRWELAEDVTARAIADSIALVEGVDPHSHVRHLTAARVVAVEDELNQRLAERSHAPTPGQTEVRVLVTAAAMRRLPDLDSGQLQAVGAITCGPQLVVVEGAAGAGKTTLLAAARESHRREYRQLIVVTPTRKAARVAAEQTGAAATSAAWLAHQNGYRWDDDGHWMRLRPGDADPTTGQIYNGPNLEAWLRPRGTLLVDEAGMLDQDTALALLTIADESHARIAFVGDRHQLPAVGRGGVLDHAVRWVDADGYVPIDTVHRFRDPSYADITLKMRSAEGPEQIFDQLIAAAAIRVHPTESARVAALVHDVVHNLLAGREVVVAADARLQVTELNLAVRDELVRAGAVDNTWTALSSDGLVGIGDKVVTRRNNTALGVANRDTWTVTDVGADYSITVTGQPGRRILPAGYVRDHVGLGYATTVHGAQGDTVEAAHVVLTNTTSAAAAYVGMTRGRDNNTAHLVATDLGDAREQWISTFRRGGADLGPHAAVQRAREEAVRYAAYRAHPHPEPARRIPSPPATRVHQPGRGVRR
jgi:exodeoxyribonuclease V alpha subunit